MTKNVISEEWLMIGKIVAPQGLKGEVRIYPDSDFPERFEVPGERWLKRPGAEALETIQLLTGRYIPNKGLYVVQFEGITTRSNAETLKDCSLYVHQSDRPQLSTGEFYLSDLIGLEVFLLETQISIGQVISLVPAGNDLLEVQLHNSEQPTVLIPFVEEIVPLINIEQGHLHIAPPPGLLPESLS